MSIAGKVVAITGASSGIGRATARLLAERGAFVVLSPTLDPNGWQRFPSPSSIPYRAG